ncbi:COX2 oxidase, partial [Agelaius phoeniceus]|nr:COX2 oxidase [Agelaius phoeniceus]
MANHSQLNFQDTSSPIIEELIGFHDHALMKGFSVKDVCDTLMVALAICSLVLYLLTHTLREKLSSRIRIRKTAHET